MVPDIHSATTWAAGPGHRRLTYIFVFPTTSLNIRFSPCRYMQWVCICVFVNASMFVSSDKSVMWMRLNIYYKPHVNGGLCKDSSNFKGSITAAENNIILVHVLKIYWTWKKKRWKKCRSGFKDNFQMIRCRIRIYHRIIETEKRRKDCSRSGSASDGNSEILGSYLSLLTHVSVYPSVGKINPWAVEVTYDESGGVQVLPQPEEALCVHQEKWVAQVTRMSNPHVKNIILDV
jgi:hypothetical protein